MRPLNFSQCATWIAVCAMGFLGGHGAAVAQGLQDAATDRGTISNPFFSVEVIWPASANMQPIVFAFPIAGLPTSIPTFSTKEINIRKFTVSEIFPNLPVVDNAIPIPIVEPTLPDVTK